MLWLLLLVLLVVLYQAGVFNQLMNSGHPPEKSALDVLNERYARGEVSTDEYEQIKATLNKSL